MPAIFSNKEKQILTAIAETLFPEGGKIPYSALEMGVSVKIESFIQNLPEDSQRGLKLLLHLINLTPIITHFRTFLKLDLKSRQKFFEKWENSWFLAKRNIAMAIKGIVCLVYYNSPEVQKIIGYTPKCLKE